MYIYIYMYTHMWLSYVFLEIIWWYFVVNIDMHVAMILFRMEMAEGQNPGTAITPGEHPID